MYDLTVSDLIFPQILVLLTKVSQYPELWAFHDVDEIPEHP